MRDREERACAKEARDLKGKLAEWEMVRYGVREECEGGVTGILRAGRERATSSACQ